MGVLATRIPVGNELKAHAIIVIKLQRKLSGNCVARDSPFAEATQDNVCVGERG